MKSETFIKSKHNNTFMIVCYTNNQPVCPYIVWYIDEKKEAKRVLRACKKWQDAKISKEIGINLSEAGHAEFKLHSYKWVRQTRAKKEKDLDEYEI